MTRRLITAREAALLTGRSPATVRKWVERGHLPVAGRGPRGVALLDVVAVWDAERDTRRRDARRTA